MVSRTLAGRVVDPATAFVRTVAGLGERTAEQTGTVCSAPSFQWPTQERAHVRWGYRFQQLHFGHRQQG